MRHYCGIFALDFDYDYLKIIAAGLASGGSIWLANRRENRKWLAQREAEQSRQIAAQGDRVFTEWGVITTQLRSMIDSLQTETIEAKKQLALERERASKFERELADSQKLSQERAAKLERELAEVQRHYDMARAELDSLKARGQRVARKRDTSAE